MTETTVPPIHTEPPEPDHRSLLRLRWVYYGLAAFDLVTVCLSVALAHRIAGLHAEGIEVNQDWALRRQEFSRLRELAELVNLPGNDVFQSRDHEGEARQLEAARVQFKDQLVRVRSAIREGVGSEVESELLTVCAAIEEAAGKLVDEARVVLARIQEGDDLEAGARMAAMDRHFFRVNGAINQLEHRVAEIQQESLQSQQAQADRLTRLEVLLVPLILMMLGGVTIYGRRLTRRLRETAGHLARHRQHLEELVEKRTAQLEASHHKMRQAERLNRLGTMGAGLGHDISNILLPMRCRLDALEQELPGPTAQEQLAGLRTCMAYLQQLCHGLRCLASGESPGEDCFLNAAEWWEGARGMFEVRLRPGVRLVAEIPKDLPPVSIAVPHLSQITLNLIGNAVDAIEGEGTVRVRMEPDDEEERIVLRVEDDGCGMTEEVVERAQEPFFTTQRRSMSTGLGLAVVRGLAVRAGGEVWIDSAVGQGTTVSVALPVARLDGPADGRVPRLAQVSVTDARSSALISACLDQFGLEVLRQEGPPEAGVDLWVLDARADQEGAARYFLQERTGRQVLAVGRGAAGWVAWGALPLPLEGGVVALREVLHAVTEAREASA